MAIPVAVLITVVVFACITLLFLVMSAIVCCGKKTQRSAKEKDQALVAPEEGYPPAEPNVSPPQKHDRKAQHGFARKPKRETTPVEEGEKPRDGGTSLRRLASELLSPGNTSLSLESESRKREVKIVSVSRKSEPHPEVDFELNPDVAAAALFPRSQRERAPSSREKAQEGTSPPQDSADTVDENAVMPQQSVEKSKYKKRTTEEKKEKTEKRSVRGGIFGLPDRLTLLGLSRGSKPTQEKEKKPSRAELSPKQLQQQSPQKHTYEDAKQKATQKSPDARADVYPRPAPSEHTVPLTFEAKLRKFSGPSDPAAPKARAKLEPDLGKLTKSKSPRKSPQPQPQPATVPAKPVEPAIPAESAKQHIEHHEPVKPTVPAAEYRKSAEQQPQKQQERKPSKKVFAQPTEDQKAWAPQETPGKTTSGDDIPTVPLDVGEYRAPKGANWIQRVVAMRDSTHTIHGIPSIAAHEIVRPEELARDNEDFDDDD